MPRDRRVSAFNFRLYVVRSRQRLIQAIQLLDNFTTLHQTVTVSTDRRIRNAVLDYKIQSHF